MPFLKFQRSAKLQSLLWALRLCASVRLLGKDRRKQMLSWKQTIRHFGTTAPDKLFLGYWKQLMLLGEEVNSSGLSITALCVPAAWEAGEQPVPCIVIILLDYFFKCSLGLAAGVPLCVLFQDNCPWGNWRLTLRCKQYLESQVYWAQRAAAQVWDCVLAAPLSQILAQAEAGV